MHAAERHIGFLEFSKSFNSDAIGNLSIFFVLLPPASPPDHFVL